MTRCPQRSTSVTRMAEALALDTLRTSTTPADSSVTYVIHPDMLSWVCTNVAQPSSAQRNFLYRERGYFGGYFSNRNADLRIGVG